MFMLFLFYLYSMLFYAYLFGCMSISLLALMLRLCLACIFIAVGLYLYVVQLIYVDIYVTVICVFSLLCCHVRRYYILFPCLCGLVSVLCFICLFTYCIVCLVVVCLLSGLLYCLLSYSNFSIVLSICVVCCLTFVLLL